MIEVISQPWPWYIAGPLIGLTVPLLLLLGNKSFGISSNLRHLCAALLPSRIPFFQYNWKRETWNLLFVAGIITGGFLAQTFLSSGESVAINTKLIQELEQAGIYAQATLAPAEIFSLNQVATLRGFVFIILGGFLVGFGTRYAGGCTSGHAITGLATFQWTSLLATIAFMVGGILTANFLLPYLLTL